MILVDEEMRRVLEFCGWKANWWEERLEPVRDASRPAITPELAEGLQAYALEQISWERRWIELWGTKWEAVRQRATAVLRDHLVAVENEVLVPIEVELDRDDEEGDYEDDGFDEEQED